MDTIGYQGITDFFGVYYFGIFIYWKSDFPSISQCAEDYKFEEKIVTNISVSTYIQKRLWKVGYWKLSGKRSYRGKQEKTQKYSPQGSKAIRDVGTLLTTPVGAGIFSPWWY
jgi:hypothetical protein